MSDHRVRSRDLKPGTRLQWRDGSVVVLARRKTREEHFSSTVPFQPGWWLRDSRGGLADSVIDAPDSEWTVLDDAHLAEGTEQ